MPANMDRCGYTAVYLHGLDLAPTNVMAPVLSALGCGGGGNTFNLVGDAIYNKQAWDYHSSICFHADSRNLEHHK